MDRTAEVERLNEADTHIAKAERAVTKQLATVEKLSRDGHDTAEALKQLGDFEAVLATMQDHRAAIVKAIEQIDAGLI